MKYVLIAILTFCSFLSAENKKEKDSKAAEVEIILRQQRELEADELILLANKNQKEGRFEEAKKAYSKAIMLYQKSSASEKRIINKIKNSRLNLITTYKALAEQMIKKAEKESSVELFNKAEKLLLEAKKVAREIKN